MAELRIYAATSFVGHGVDADSIGRALQFKPDAIVAQGTTTDAGPYYLGTGRLVMPKEALRRDVELMVAAAVQARVPFIVSVGGAGGDAQLEVALQCLDQICRDRGFRLRLAVISGEVDKELVLAKIRAGVKIPRLVEHPRLSPYLTEEDVSRTVRLVAQVGPEVVMDALSMPGVQGVVAGRALDIGLYAALPLLRGFEKGLAMHMGKCMECGGISADPGSGADGVFAYLREDHFCLVPPNPRRRCTVKSVAGHAFYERSDPAREENPGGILDVTDAKYEQVDERTVKVSGGRWIPVPEYRVKLEGAARVGYRAISVGGVCDPRFIAAVDEILTSVREETDRYFAYLPSGSFNVALKVYGKGAILGGRISRTEMPGEICILVDVLAAEQELAEAVCAFVNSTLSHHGFPGRLSTAGNLAMPFSPGRSIPVGEAFIFNVWHGLPLESPGEAFRVRVEEFPRRKD